MKYSMNIWSDNIYETGITMRDKGIMDNSMGMELCILMTFVYMGFLKRE